MPRIVLFPGSSKSGGGDPASSSASAAASASSSAWDYGQEQDVHSLLIVDQNTFEVLHSHQLMNQEFGLSLLSCRLGDDPCPYYVVGTGVINPEESESKTGRILLFQWKDGENAICASFTKRTHSDSPLSGIDLGKFNAVHEKDIKGACYSLNHFNRKLLSSINSTGAY